MSRLVSYAPLHKALPKSVVILFMVLMTGCASSVPDLHSRDFSEFHKDAGNSSGAIAWDRSAGVPVELSEDQFGTMVVNSTSPVLVEFFASWCGYCAKFKPVLMELAAKYEGRVRFAVINAEKNRNLTSKMGVKMYPAFFLVRDGEVLDEWYGTDGGKEAVEKKLQGQLSID